MQRLTALIAGFAFLTATAESGAQMPDWSEFRDLEGNVYYYDRAGKIRIIEKTGDSLRPVTADGIEYHLNRGLTCLQEKKIPQGLAVLKSILAMKPVNSLVQDAQVKSAAAINRLKKREMDRFDMYSERSCLLMYKDEGVTHVMNDHAGYSFETRGDIGLIRTRERRALDYEYHGSLWGVRTRAKDRAAGGYDLIVAVDFERFKGPVRDMDEAMGRMARVTGFGAVERKTIEKNDRRLIMNFTSASSLSGYDGVFMRGNYLFMVRVACNGTLYESNGELMKAIIMSFSTLPHDSIRDGAR